MYLYGFILGSLATAILLFSLHLIPDADPAEDELSAQLMTALGDAEHELAEERFLCQKFAAVLRVYRATERGELPPWPRTEEFASDVLAEYEAARERREAQR